MTSQDRSPLPPPPPNGTVGVVIGLDTIYAQMQSMAQNQTALSGKIDGFILTWNAQAEGLGREIGRTRADLTEKINAVERETALKHDEVAKKQEKYEERLRNLEQKRYLEPKDLRASVAIILTAIGICVSIAVAILK